MEYGRLLEIGRPVVDAQVGRSAAKRLRAALCASTIPRASVFSPLLKIARNDPDEEVRQQAVFWLGQVPDERAVDMLQEILRKSKDEELQNKALFALSQHRSGRGSAILREFALATRPKSCAARRSSGSVRERSAENNEFLRSLYSRLNSDELKEKVLFSLSQRKGVGNDKWMMDIALDSRRRTSSFARRRCSGRDRAASGSTRSFRSTRRSTTRR